MEPEEKQIASVVHSTREWLRSWTADQREMVLWILEEEVRNDKLMNVELEDGSSLSSEKNAGRG
jgi:hypothetical protein